MKVDTIVSQRRVSTSVVLLVSMLARGVVRASGVMSPANNHRYGLRRFGFYIEYYIGYQRFRRDSVPNPKPETLHDLPSVSWE